MGSGPKAALGMCIGDKFHANSKFSLKLGWDQYQRQYWYLFGRIIEDSIIRVLEVTLYAPRLCIGADIELGASTALMEAAQEGNIDIVKFLIEKGANIHAETSTSDTALTYACANGHTIIADILLQCGAELVRLHVFINICFQA